MVVVVILVALLIGLSVALLMYAIVEPRVRRSENLAGIKAYGYAGAPQPDAPRRPARASLDQLAGSLGDVVAKRISTFREEEVQRELVAAGFFRVGARRFLGYRVMSAILVPLLAIWLLSLSGTSAAMLVVFVIAAVVLGWRAPSFYVHRRARLRLQSVDEGLPWMIDLLVVTLEAGIGFVQALHLAADRLTGPLGDEVRLTIQEQTLGLSMLAALENWLKRCDTPNVRSFVRAMVQGDRLGVSIGTILRNQAIEMRARQRAQVTERAQKAPIKILFPLVFLIFPAMFVVILGPALFSIASSFGSV
jgi:tight adherence protein C